jgi:hypothetical protein
MDKLKAALDDLPPRPWSVSTSCSFRRLTGPDGVDGGVLHGTTHRSDGHPDLSMGEDALRALCDVVNAADTLPRWRTVAVDGMPVVGEHDDQRFIVERDTGELDMLWAVGEGWVDAGGWTRPVFPTDRYIPLAELALLPGGSGG